MVKGCPGSCQVGRTEAVEARQADEPGANAVVPEGRVVRSVSSNTLFAIFKHERTKRMDYLGAAVYTLSSLALGLREYRAGNLWSPGLAIVLAPFFCYGLLLPFRRFMRGARPFLLWGLLSVMSSHAIAGWLGCTVDLYKQHLERTNYVMVAFMSAFINPILLQLPSPLSSALVVLVVTARLLLMANMREGLAAMEACLTISGLTAGWYISRRLDQQHYQEYLRSQEENSSPKISASGSKG